MPDTIARCFECRDPVDPHGKEAVVELNPNGTGDAGYYRGHLCSDCESDLVEKMKPTTGGNA
jgi:hypothetical protein